MSRQSRDKTQDAREKEREKRNLAAGRALRRGASRKGENSSSDPVSLLHLIILLVLIASLIYFLKK